jgi:hypothetical protein
MSQSISLVTAILCPSLFVARGLAISTAIASENTSQDQYALYQGSTASLVVISKADQFI